MDWNTIEVLARDVEEKDTCTSAHTVRVALYAQALAEDEGVPEENVQRFMQAAMLHDIGKIDIPNHILTKPGRLTDAEYATMRQHTVLGHDRLVSMGVTDQVILGLVRWHHEHMDGSGYPDALRGDTIPIPARYFGVIDCFDALTSVRPYRDDIGPDAAERAIEELQRHSGTWYWPEAVDRFERLYRSGQLDWILMHLNDRSPIVRAASPREMMALSFAKRSMGARPGRTG